VSTTGVIKISGSVYIRGMPAQLTHWIFFKDLYFRLLSEDPLWGEFPSHKSLDFLGAQGGDIFYHNQRTKPSGISYGSLLHRRKGDRFLINLAKRLPSRYYTFWLAFMSHALLDQEAHPFVVYFSTPADLTGHNRKKWNRMHPFFERIIDRLLWEGQEKRPLSLWSLTELLDHPFSPSMELIDALGLALGDTYGKKVNQEDREIRIRNAFWDTLGFLLYSDPGEEENARWACRQDLSQSPEGGRRRLALFHPRCDLSHRDYLNREKKSWIHPVTKVETRDSWFDIYNRALDRGLRAGRIFMQYHQGGCSLDPLEEVVTSRTWNVGDQNGRSHSPLETDPLPLVDDFIREYSFLDSP